MLTGFTDYTYKGKPVFIREEYESANYGRSEQDRISDLIGICYEDVHRAMVYMESNYPHLLYRRVDYQTDDNLRDHEDYELCWEPFRNGYVHRVTGEYVEGEKPMRDSYPCWCLSVPNIYYSTNEQVKNRIGEELSSMAYGILTLIALFTLNDSED